MIKSRAEAYMAANQQTKPESDNDLLFSINALLYQINQKLGVIAVVFVLMFLLTMCSVLK
jgi:uncharacterized membrane protein YkgB